MDAARACRRARRIARRAVEARRALGPTGRPELAQLAAELLARGGPVVGDVIAQLLDVALEVEFVLLEPADVELLAGRAALELAGNVLFIVSDDSAYALLVRKSNVLASPLPNLPGNKARCADALCALCD